MVINSNTGEINQLTNNQDNNFSPSIDGTGAHVAFQGNIAGFTQLFIASQVSGTVGGATVPVNRLALLAPFVVSVAVAVSICGALLYTRRRSKTNSQASKRRNNSTL